MPTILNNNFSADTYSIRLERLSTIQTNISLIQAELEAPVEIIDWSENCFINFSAKITQRDAESSESEAATLEATAKSAILDENYQNCRIFFTSFLKDQPFRLKEFKFDMEFPSDRQMKIKKAEHILEIAERQADDGVATTIPPVLQDRLLESIENYRDALTNQEVHAKQASYSYLKLAEQFENDTLMLQKLRSWWYISLGKKDPRISLIGMVNPEIGGRPSGTLSAPSNFRYDYAEVAIRWSAVSGATSYQVEFSEDNTNWEVIYEGPDTEFLTNPMLAEHTYLRARARNSNGFSAYTSTVNIVYDLTLPMAQNLTYLPAYPGFNWDVVPGAINYEVHLRNQSAPPDEWLKIYFGNDNTLYHADPIGSYAYRIRSWNNQGTSAWAELEYSVTP